MDIIGKLVIWSLMGGAVLFTVIYFFCIIVDNIRDARWWARYQRENPVRGIFVGPVPTADVDSAALIREDIAWYAPSLPLKPPQKAEGK